MNAPIVISLCDYTGIMVAPWADAGYHVVMVDPQHERTETVGNWTKLAGCIDEVMPKLGEIIRSGRVALVAGFPPCTDVAVSGAAHWARKAEADRYFQAKAAIVGEQCRTIGAMSGAPWFFENPVSGFSRIFGKPSFSFHPFEYGGYLPEGDEHPHYPEYFPSRDAYGKKTCIWAGGGFVMPEKRPVLLLDDQAAGQGQSKAHNKLGGKSQKTKNIRSATPRGFARAVFESLGREAVAA